VRLGGAEPGFVQLDVDVSRGVPRRAAQGPEPAAAQEGVTVGGIEGRIIKGPGYRGVVFPESAEVGPPTAHNRWTPTDADVAEAERLVREGLSSLVPSPSSQKEAVPRIVARLAEYRRQYVGLRAEAGEQTVWINFFRAGEDQYPDWKRSIVSIRGGGEDYFQLTVDMDAFSCRGLRINLPR
jgi:hypothetical protein